MKNLLIGILGIALTHLVFAQANPAKTTVNLGVLSITSTSGRIDGIGKMILTGLDTPFLKFDCIDGGPDVGVRPANTFLIVNTLKSIGSQKHQIFTGTSDFYCQGVYLKLFGGLRAGDQVSIDLSITVEKSNFRSDIPAEIVKIEDVILTVIKSGPLSGQNRSTVRSLKSNPGTMVEFSSFEVIP